MREMLPIDWDGTCVEEKFPAIDGLWLPGATKALRTLHKHYEIVIHTCRVAPVMQDGVTPHREVQKQVDAISERLDEIGLSGVEVWQRPYKPNGVFYIDNKNIVFDGNWPKVVRQLTGRLK